MFNNFLTDEEQLFMDTVNQFLVQEVPKTSVRQWDEQAVFPYQLYEKAVQNGWIGMIFPEEYGGANAPLMDLILFAEVLGQRGYDFGIGFVMPVFVGLNVLKHGNEQQKIKLLPKLTAGKIRFSISITEPDAGSDAANLSTSARRVSDGWVLNGRKVFSSGAHLANTIILMACRTDPSLPKRKGISFFLVPNDTPGLEIYPMKTLGRHIVLTNEITLRDVHVSEDALLGPLNGGFSVLTDGLNIERLTSAALYVGNAKAILDDCLAYAKSRVQFGQPIGKFQVISHMIADMATQVDAARLLTYRAAQSYEDDPHKAIAALSMAKLYASEILARAANIGMQILGGYGYTKEYDMERYYRIARITTVVGGSSQMQRNTIAKQLGL